MADLTADEHLAMQAAAQAHVDSSISKTINVPADFSFSDFAAVYEKAWRLGLKGCTTFRPNAVTGSILSELKLDECPPVVAIISTTRKAAKPAATVAPLFVVDKTSNIVLFLFSC